MLDVVWISSSFASGLVLICSSSIEGETDTCGVERAGSVDYSDYCRSQGQVSTTTLLQFVEYTIPAAQLEGLLC